MTNVTELKDALKETLEERGVLNEVRAMMRKSIFDAIESDDKPKPKLTDENLMINELIREYLIYNNYLHTNSVLISESGQPTQPPFDRNFMAKELNIVEDTSSKRVPLLYSILFGLKQEYYQPANSNPNINSNLNPMSMVANSSMAPKVSQSNNMLEQKPDQPKPWVIE